MASRSVPAFRSSWWLVLALATAVPLGAVATARAGSSSASPTSAVMPEIEGRLAEIERRLEAAGKELGDSSRGRGLADERLRARGRLLYRELRAGMLPLGSGFDAMIEHARRVERLRWAVRRDLDEHERLARRAVELATVTESLSAERVALVEKKRLVEEARREVDEERRRRESFDRAFGGGAVGDVSTLSGSDAVVYGPSGPVTPESAQTGSFRARRGRLTFPVGGPSEVHPTTREGGPGVEIRASLGAVVRATHAGRVAFADRYGTYGPLVILDHGDRCYTVSANLGTIDVKVGADVAAGERIGTVGDDGRGPSLYFEIRIGSDKVRPAAWLGL